VQSSGLISQSVQTNADDLDQDLSLETIRELPTDDNLVESDRPETHKVGVPDTSIDQLQRSTEWVDLRSEQSTEVNPLFS
jgi:hypothetical protein